MLIVFRLIIERQKSLDMPVGFRQVAAKPRYRKGSVVRLQQDIGTIAIARNREQVCSNAFRSIELTERSVIEPPSSGGASSTELPSRFATTAASSNATPTSGDAQPWMLISAGPRRERMTPMTERRDANLFKVLIAQIRQNIKGNVILGKALRVLPETRLLKPVRNLLHRGPLRIQRYPFWTGTSTLAPARACCGPQRKGPHVLSGRLGHSTTPALCPGFLRKSKSVSDYA
jgi:hypothetical protein